MENVKCSFILNVECSFMLNICLLCHSQYFQCLRMLESSLSKTLNINGLSNL